MVSVPQTLLFKGLLSNPWDTAAAAEAAAAPLREILSFTLQYGLKSSYFEEV